MTPFGLRRLQNSMLVANGLSNLIGVAIVMLITRTTHIPLPEPVRQILNQVDRFFLPCSFIVPILVIIWYERPIRLFIRRRFSGEPIPDTIQQLARRKLLNEPFFLIIVNLSIWLSAAIVYATALWMHKADWFFVRNSMFNALFTGLITVTVAFFVLEHVLQRHGLAAFFFPDGGLSKMPGTYRIRIRTRLIAFLAACNLVPFLNIIFLLYRFPATETDPIAAAETLRSTIRMNALIFMGIGIWLVMLVSMTLSRSFREIVQVLQGISSGRFDKKVQVTTNDELGYTGDVINEMTAGLKERNRMRRSLEIAKEVQQNLLPLENPEVEGLDIAGRSIYCDETGGDYYDFLESKHPGDGKIGIVLGDVSGHGISSALLMASVRAFLRQRAAMPGSINEVIGDVNRQLAGDVVESGSFMTLFYLTVDAMQRKLEWVRAGHDAAILYHAGQDAFSELKGRGIALGVDEQTTYEKYETADLSEDHLIVLGTDGIWEATDAKGRMLGKAPVYEIIRKFADRDAATILEAVVNELLEFKGTARLEDDVTLIVIKFSGPHNR